MNENENTYTSLEMSSVDGFNPASETTMEVALEPTVEHEIPVGLVTEAITNEAYSPSESFRTSITLGESDEIYESQFPYSEHAAAMLEHFTLDMKKYSSWDEGIAAAQEALLLQGAVILENTGLKNLAELNRMCKPFGSLMDYIGGTNDRANQGEGVLNVGTEPPWANVAAHNEMSYSNVYPELFIIGCKSAPKIGGCTVIADNQLITKALLQTEFGEKLRLLGVRYIRNFHDAQTPNVNGASFTSWQQVFGTNDREEAVARAKVILGGDQICEVETTMHGGLRMMYNAPAYEYDPETQIDMLFMSVGNHGYWFRQWPPYNEVPHIDRPFHMQFGDGSEFTEADLSLFAKITNEYGYPIQWGPEKIAILKNRRFTHARPPYQLAEGEKRELGVVLMNSTPRAGQTI